MPSTTPDREARWPGGDSQAIDYLMKQGYSMTKDWCWVKPTDDHKPTEKEIDAVIYLIEEWDFGGIL
jgi:hypothetical protein